MMKNNHIMMDDDSDDEPNPYRLLSDEVCSFLNI